MSSGAHNKQVIRKRTRKYDIFRIPLFQHNAGVQKPGRALELRDKKFGQKKGTLGLRYKMAARLIFTPAVSVLHDVG